MTVPLTPNTKITSESALREAFPRHWTAMHTALNLMSLTGCCIVQELSESLAERMNWDSNSFVARYTFRQRLRISGLVHYETLPYFRSGLAVVRLTEAGKLYCHQQKWPVVKSEWETLIEMHEGEKSPQHTALVLAFAREARWRGYMTTVIPLVDGLSGRLLPDILVDDGRERAYVEVERSRVVKREKWENLDRLQAFVAFCVQSYSRRLRLSNRLSELGFTGVATDLETLSQQRVAGDPGSLWQGEF